MTTRTSWWKAAAAALALMVPTSAQGMPQVQVSDVIRFFQIYDQAGGRPDAEMLQRDYLAVGTPGLTRFASLRRITGESIAASLAANPDLYAEARGCVDILPQVTQRVDAAIADFQTLSPGADFPPVTIAIGRGRPIAVGEAAGAYIGLEALCAWELPDPNVEDRIVRVIVHELVHTRQTGLAEHADGATVLHAALVEGAAEFVTELLTGSVAYRHLQTAARGRELEIEQAFLRDIDQPALGSSWVYNGGAGSNRPADLGYWVGYRIAKAYWLRAQDKTRAIADILSASDAHAFLEQSGWYPGMVQVD